MIKYEDKCTVINEGRNMHVEVEVDNYRSGKSFTAYLAGTKFQMRYNESRKLYEGYVAGMDLSSKGPKEWKI